MNGDDKTATLRAGSANPNRRRGAIKKKPHYMVNGDGKNRVLPLACLVDLNNTTFGQEHCQ